MQQGWGPSHTRAHDATRILLCAALYAAMLLAAQILAVAS